MEYIENEKLIIRCNSEKEYNEVCERLYELYPKDKAYKQEYSKGYDTILFLPAPYGIVVHPRKYNQCEGRKDHKHITGYNFLQKFLPKEEPKPAEPKPKFYVGQRVKVYRNTSREDGKGVGQVFTITSYCKEWDGYVYQGVGGGWSEYNLQPHPDEKEKQFVGIIDDLCAPQFEANKAFKIIDNYCKKQFIKELKEKGVIMSAVDTVKKLALKATNPEEYELREAGLHDSDGEITEEGWQLAKHYLVETVKEKLVKAAKEINEAKKEKK